MNDLARNIRNRMSSAIGKRCWGVIVGGCTLPQFTMALGKKVKREVPIENPALSKVARIFEGEVNFFIRCSWRLEHQSSVVVTSGDKEQHITTALNHLPGRLLEQIRLGMPSWDLYLSFSEGWLLKMFADCEIHGYDTLRNWHFNMENVEICAGPGENIDVEDL